LYTGDYNDCQRIGPASVILKDSLDKAGYVQGASEAHAGLDSVDDEAQDTLPEPAESAIEPIQSTNVIMYAMADRYDIAPLKDLAKSKFAACEGSSWSRELPNLIELVYTSTPETDRGLRDALQKEYGSAWNFFWMIRIS